MFREEQKAHDARLEEVGASDGSEELSRIVRYAARSVYMMNSTLRTTELRRRESRS